MPPGPPALVKELIQVLQIGNYRSTACTYVGLSIDTFYNWMSRGKTDTDGVYFEFRHAVLRAEAKSEVAAVTAIRRAISTDPRAAFEFLARKFPQKWGRNNSLNVNLNAGPGGVVEDDDEPDLTPDQIATFARQVAQVESVKLLTGPGAGVEVESEAEA